MQYNTLVFIVVVLVLAVVMFSKRRNHFRFEAEARPNNSYDFSPYLKENTTLHHYKDQLVNAV
jgi:hypothetical protein